MKRPLITTAPAFAVILALTSTPAFAANKRTAGTSTENRAAAQGTAAQSVHQQGTVDSGSPTQGAARRARMGSFVSDASATTKKEREVNAHIADVDAFLRMADGGFAPALVEGDIKAAKDQILNGPSSPEHSKMYAFVAQLAKTDEKALEALFYLHSTYSSALLLKLGKPDLAAAIDRLGSKLSAAGIVNNFDGFKFTINPVSASAILTAPGARALLHKLVGRTEVQKGSREALVVESILKHGPQTLTYQGDFYPTRSAAVSKSSRHSGKIADETGAETSIKLEIISRNVEPDGLKPAIWESTGEAVLSVGDQAASTGSKKIVLTYKGTFYPARTTATERYHRYEGKVAIGGTSYSVVANVVEKNISSDGLFPQWESAKETVISVEPKK